VLGFLIASRCRGVFGGEAAIFLTALTTSAATDSFIFFLMFSLMFSLTISMFSVSIARQYPHLGSYRTRTSNIPTLILVVLSLEAIFVLGVAGDKTFVAVDGVGDSGCLALRGVERVVRVARVTRARFGVLGSSSSTGSCLTTIVSPISSSSCILENLRFVRFVVGEITGCY
jgi:hypothetical protein